MVSAHLPDSSRWLSVGHQSFPLCDLRSFRRLGIFSDLREVFQESDSRSCRASSGLALEVTQGHFCV